MKFRCNKAICHAVFLAPGPLPAFFSRKAGSSIGSTHPW